MWKNLTPKDNEIIIGHEHPMRYAFSILVLAHKFGEVKVWVRKNKHYTDPKGRYRTLDDQWKDIQKFVINYAEMKIVDKNESETDKIYTLVW